MLNKAQVIGHLGQDPKITTSQYGTIASFSVATTEKGYTTKAGTQVPDRTEWHNIVCFGRIADVVKSYLKKGSKVFVEGKMRTRQYESRDGIKRSITEIHADALEMLDSKPIEVGVQQQPIGQTQTDDNIPF
jgi:single-strand DNA-binding protein